MRATVSRTHAEAANDEEWPGKDLRNLKQSIILWTEDGLGVETAAPCADTEGRKNSGGGEVGAKVAKAAKRAEVGDNPLTNAMCQRRLSRSWR